MPLSWNEIKSRALTFSRTWADAANEDSQGKPFWIDFFEIFGITDKRVATFEHAVKKLLGEKARVDGFVDLFWPGMLLVEQKSRGKNLDAALTQALSYFPGIAERDLPQLVIVCDFAHFRVHRLTTNETFEFALKDLHKNIKLFGFIAGYKALEIKPQDPVNIKAAERMGRLHDALKASGYTGHPLEVLLVRLLFCLFADDTGIFQPAQSFRTFIEERTSTDGSDLGSRLGQLFQVLNTPEDKRSKALDEQVAAFQYVNGKLFEEPLPMADFTSAMREALLDACALDWSAISPAIFGSLFQSIMDDKARRNLGAHYTSEENILKLIKPLFLDDLWAEFNKVKGNKNRLFEFHKKLRLLTFFDPACGCGNFLVISYRELRLLELEVLRASISDRQLGVDIHGLIGINVDQFYGIEIEEFPAQIAQVALWLMDHQMNLRVSEEFGLYFARIPLRTTPHIVHGNALRLDWNEVLPAERCSFVLGNPPFSGKHYQSKEQKAEALLVYDGMKSASDLDYVAAWFVKAAKYVQGTAAACAFVSTNSLTQGEQVPLLWPLLLQKYGIKIRFAHRTFQWSNEASGMAAVHCVIIGFGCTEVQQKRLFEYETPKSTPHELTVEHISPYLTTAPDVIVSKRSSPIGNAPNMGCGSKPSDGGNLILDTAEKSELLAVEPGAAAYLKPFVGSQEFLNGGERWCLWLENITPAALKQLPHVLRRVQLVKTFREASTAEPTRRAAATPSRFFFVAQPNTQYIAIPEVSSERRTYVPVGYLPAEVIASNKLYIIDKPSLFVFGVLQSMMHGAWTRTVAGRLKSDIQYSGTMVYNNFPWPDFPQNSKQNQPPAPVDKAQAAIETAAQVVLDARAQFQSGEQPATLADLYDPLTMPPELLRAHQKLDAAVDKAYERSGGKKSYKSDAERVAFLFELYQKYTSLLPTGKPQIKRKARSAGAD
ncbi:MAG TPA: SAM-dependent methyltransferase [Polaromonas sp.]|uniref:class I SAM-dependent DNA methyltransferase n=1 Tax=Polaromonas sp. UBA4122 TaxID=1947074 RepID=UPI000EC569D8|nr:DNA methyltransferase [Polaromonas sp. UBA4122]HAL40380.1 SAM-dependent methyltransferase [Polaromonas sp.]